MSCTTFHRQIIHPDFFSLPFTSQGQHIQMSIKISIPAVPEKKKKKKTIFSLWLYGMKLL